MSAIRRVVEMEESLDKLEGTIEYLHGLFSKIMVQSKELYECPEQEKIKQLAAEGVYVIALEKEEMENER